MKIQQVIVNIIPDSRGEETLEAQMVLDGIRVSASVPSGKSKGSGEVFVLDPGLAVKKFDEMRPKILRDFASLEEFDRFLIELDGAVEKKNLGGNLVLALSIAFTKAWAKLQNLETFQLISQISKQEIKLPFCFFNLIEGGVHAENSLPFQEYLLVPQSLSPKQSLETVTKTVEFLREKIQKQYGQVKQGDEGGFAIPSHDPQVGLQILNELIDENKLESKISLDVAASTFLENGSYRVGEKMMNRDELVSYYQLLATNYQLLSVEDPFAEDDFEGFEKITKDLGSKTWVVGDDLTTTNPERIKSAHGKSAINAVIIKPNQIGSVTETLQSANLAKSFGWKIIVSHRSGETLDNFIADLAVGVGADGLKSGCPLQKERLVKYKRLVEIEKLWPI